MRMRGHGIGADLPRGWEGNIRAEKRAEAAAQMRASGAPEHARNGPDPVTAPVAHFATFALPVERDEFGGDLIEVMDDDDVFVALLEYGAAEVGTALFSEQGLPRRLDPRLFGPGSLQRSRPGTVGHQRFFTEGGRAFCLYVVIRGDDVHRHVRRVERLLATVEIEPR